MMTQEIAKVLMEEWLLEFLKSLDNQDPEEAWCTEYETGKYIVDMFLQWLEKNK